MRPWILVSPGSSGIGLSLARRILTTTTCPVIATGRGDLDQIRTSLLSGGSAPKDTESRLEVLKLDVTEEESIASVAAHCKSRFPSSGWHLHLALTAPGILRAEKSPAQIDYAAALQTFKVNSLGPLMLMKHFGQFLPSKRAPLPSSTDANARGSSGADEELYKGLNQQSAIWASLSARVGSITDNKLGGWYSYRASKAALNQLVKTFDNHLRNASGENAFAIGLHPGTVKTNLSKYYWSNVKQELLFEPDWVAGRLVGICSTGVGAQEGWTGQGEDQGVKAVRLESRGKCLDYDGKEVPP